MSSDKIVVDTTSYTARQELITWWDQAKLRAANVLVVGAGALGNEIVKNLALVGVGNITIVDMDTIELSNLSRCIFFRESDDGSYKAEVLAREAERLNPYTKTRYFTTPVQDLGDAYLQQFNLIIAGLDNREARVWLGGAARRAGKVWIDAAIEGLMGKVQTFTPDGPCYACSMGDKDWELLAHKKSCKLLGTEEILAGHTPTNATTSSIIAGIQTQEAIKYLAEVDPSMHALENKVWRMIGEQMATFSSLIEIDEFCPFHFDPIETTHHAELPSRLSELWGSLSLDDDTQIGFYDDFLFIHGCSPCNTAPTFGYKDLLGKQGVCQKCGAERLVDLQSRISKNDPITDLYVEREFWPQHTFAQIRKPDGEERIELTRGAKTTTWSVG
jgi:molybdopterin/thiamine biosynthesis adenylyltransferase